MLLFVSRELRKQNTKGHILLYLVKFNILVRRWIAKLSSVYVYLTQ